MSIESTRHTVEKAFANSDKDELSLIELKVALSELGKDDVESEMLLTNIALRISDGNGEETSTCDGFINSLSDGDTFYGLTLNIGLFSVVNTMEMIRAADKEGNGFLNAAELKELLLKMDPKDKAKVDQKVESLINMASVDGEKKLNIEEAIELISVPYENDEKSMKSMFRMCDSNGDGYIEKKELFKFLQCFNADLDETDKQTRKSLASLTLVLMDEDQDGKISYGEFCNWFETDCDSD